ncbi:MAG: hypothetical protein NTX59_09360 [Elusimicrobia bacterium]|nr:hypothetical protein [Elusimicrobiota bacterium]
MEKLIKIPPLFVIIAIEVFFATFLWRSETLDTNEAPAKGLCLI